MFYHANLQLLEIQQSHFCEKKIVFFKLVVWSNEKNTGIEEDFIFMMYPSSIFDFSFHTG